MYLSSSHRRLNITVMIYESFTNIAVVFQQYPNAFMGTQIRNGFKMSPGFSHTLLFNETFEVARNRLHLNILQRAIHSLLYY